MYDCCKSTGMVGSDRDEGSGSCCSMDGWSIRRNVYCRQIDGDAMMSAEENHDEAAEEIVPVQEAIRAMDQPHQTTVRPTRDAPVTEEQVQDLMLQLNKPWGSAETAAMAIATILGRVMEDALGQYVRVRLRSRDRPGAESYWNVFHEIVDAGLKIVTALRTAYNWDVLSKQMNTAIAEMEQMKKKGMISEDSYKNIMKAKKKLDEAVTAHAT